MAQVTLQGIKRELKTKGYLTELRKNGYVPAVYYAHGEENIFLAVPENKLKHIVFSPETYLINLEIEGVGQKTCILKEFQLDPVTDKIVHVDFHGLKAGEKVNVEVMVHLIGTPIGVREGGIIQHSLHKIEIECLPTEIPEKIDVDISNLKIGDALHVKDLDLPSYRILTNPEATIITIVPPALHKEEAAGEGAAPTEQAEPEVIQKGKKTEEEEK
ncbi:MAG: 50S ribosomal protein L25 [Ignavibacteria bacterium]|jgi:large subunit ribosomal protein L25|nr:50S ribosomal protein L25 [Ignavibacteria bacterium]MDH7528839.1 50S ribosomal protein L25 [Ignavibacteria bacterium]